MEDISFIFGSNAIDAKNRLIKTSIDSKFNDDIQNQWNSNNYDQTFESGAFLERGNTDSIMNLLQTNSVQTSANEMSYIQSNLKLDNIHRNLNLYHPNPNQITTHNSTQASNLQTIGQSKQRCFIQNADGIDNMGMRILQNHRRDNFSDIYPQEVGSTSASDNFNSIEKLEKSRQSARDCRARKKVKYDFLEIMIKEEEKQISDAKRQLDETLGFVKLIESGNINPLAFECPNPKLGVAKSSSKANALSSSSSSSTLAAASSSHGEMSSPAHIFESIDSNWNMGPKFMTTNGPPLNFSKKISTSMNVHSSPHNSRNPQLMPFATSQQYQQLRSPNRYINSGNKSSCEIPSQQSGIFRQDKNYSPNNNIKKFANGDFTDSGSSSFDCITSLGFREFNFQNQLDRIEPNSNNDISLIDIKNDRVSDHNKLSTNSPSIVNIYESFGV